MWFRLTENGYLAYVDRVVLAYRRHPENISAQTARMAAVTDAMLLKRAASLSLTPEQRKLLQHGTRCRPRVVAELRWQWAREHWKCGRYRHAAKEIRHMVKAFAQYALGYFLVRVAP